MHRDLLALEGIILACEAVVHGLNNLNNDSLPSLPQNQPLAHGRACEGRSRLVVICAIGSFSLEQSPSAWSDVTPRRRKIDSTGFAGYLIFEGQLAKSTHGSGPQLAAREM